MNIKEFVIQQTAGLQEYQKIRYAFRLLRNLMVHEIVGHPPRATLLQQAWEYKKQYTVDFINNYYTIHKKLPRHTHNIGNSFFPSVSSHINFTSLKQQLVVNCTTKSIDEFPSWILKEI